MDKVVRLLGYMTLYVFTPVICKSENKLIFLLVDGFRWDYFEIPGVRLNGFSRLFIEGTRAEWIVPDFPTISWPNYKTLETGRVIMSNLKVTS